MTDTPFTVRNVAKFAIKAAIAAKTSMITAQTIENNTRFEKDDTVVEIGSTVVGWYVSSKIKPVTDKMVDKTFDFIAAKRAERQAKKTDQ